MENVYDVFDLKWRSCNLDLDELKKADYSEIDVVIKNRDSIEWPKIPIGKYDNEFVNISENDLRLSIDGIGKFRIYNGNKIFWHKENLSINDRDIANFLLGSSFGAILIQRGILVLHANALVKNNKCVICAGPSGSGKSTLAYFLISKGWKLITDDLVAINDDLNVLPGIQRIKLWEDAMKYFDLNVKEFTKVREGINKYVLLKNSFNSFEEKIKIDSIYFIENRFSNLNNYGITKLESEQKKFKKLIKNIYRPRFVRGLKAESRNFIKLAKISRKAEIYSLNLPNSLEKLDLLVNSYF